MRKLLERPNEPRLNLLGHLSRAVVSRVWTLLLLLLLKLLLLLL